jgi:transposase
MWALFFMAYIQGKSNDQGTLFPVTFDDLIPDDHLVRVIDAYIKSLDLAKLGFDKATPAQTGRPAYHPQHLLKLYLYGYFHRIRSSRRLEAECQRNIEVMWLLDRLTPDFKTIANFRQGNGQAFVQVCRAFVQFCRYARLIAGDLVAIDGSKFAAVASPRKHISLDKLKRQDSKLEQQITTYLTQLDATDQTDNNTDIDQQAVRQALQRLRHLQADNQSSQALMEELGLTQSVMGEPDAKKMRTHKGTLIGYNVQSAVDSLHGLIVHHDVTNAGNDQHQLLPMAQAVQGVFSSPLSDDQPADQKLKFVADAGYSTGEQLEQCEEQGIEAYVALNRGVNNQSPNKDQPFFNSSHFDYDAGQDVYTCPNAKQLRLKQLNKGARIYAASEDECGRCLLNTQCTQAKRRYITRHANEATFERMAKRLAAHPEMMVQRRSIVEHPFGNLKYWIMGNAGRFLVRGFAKVRGEMALAVNAYNFKRAFKELGARRMMELLEQGVR